IAIAQNQIPQESWFALGRRFTSAGNLPVLLSWSGSMFEYLMPMLVMPSFENTLLDQAMKGVIKKQVEYGKQQGVPWGVSESGYNMVDAALNYQYRAFGVPGLGLKRGLGEDLVIAPYATVMALMVDPEEAYKNMRTLAEQGFEGKFGFYEAIDYTPSRLPRGQSFSVIRSFMVHHEGMSFLSLAWLLLNQPMQRRFQQEVQFKAAELLLQERVPKTTASYTQNTADDINVIGSNEPEMRIINTPNTPVPEVQLLSNGRYHVMITNSGAGYSRWKDLALTRWQEDGVADNTGIFCYLRDVEEGYYWSTAFHPTRSEGKNYEVVFSQGRAEFRRRDYDIETHTEIVVSPEDDMEMRRLHLVNRSRKRRTIEVTSYAEVVINSPMADAAHPAFSNLFVQTELVPGSKAILCTRRPRSAEEKNPWMFHLMITHGGQTQEITYETDRMKFTGRGNTLAQPAFAKAAAGKPSLLSNTQGSVLDPIVSISHRIMLEPLEAVTVDMLYGIGATRESCIALVDKYQDKNLADRVLELAWTHSQVVLRQINATEGDAQLYGRLASSVIYTNPVLRADPEVLIKNKRGQSGLWSHSISGDIPIVLVEIENASNIDLVRQMVQAHAFWRLKGLLSDLVIWNQDHGSYRQTLHNMLFGLTSPGVEADLTDRPGGIFIKSADQLSNEDRVLLQTVARVIISDKDGTLQEQVNRRARPKTAAPQPFPLRAGIPPVHTISPGKDWQFFNGLGGFSSDGKEYLVITGPDNRTPAPWVNVLANPMIGTVVSESGSAYTWYENAHEYRLSPWHNDPVRDTSGEAIYIRDEETGYTWSPTPLPNRSASSYLCRHGFGYSVFEHEEDGIRSEVWMYVDLEAAIKFTVVKLHNHSGRPRQLSVTGYCEWVLGDLRPKYAMHVITEKDADTGALFANNPYHAEFGHYFSFMDTDEPGYNYTADRAEFLGRNGSMVFPEAMKRIRLSGKAGAGMDPCAAIRVFYELGEDEEKSTVFRLGAARDFASAKALAQQFRGREAAEQALQKVRQWWEHTLDTVRVQTPDAALNLLTNGWLLYQVIAARLWARSGYYQS
ncbi:MAG: cyclic beta 1-2 glucan synthetase, partial [Bacteroidetes bacterium]|nr:cyclic beta 1-2 glucan synthetase [Bacteroidota bacterium]